MTAPQEIEDSKRCPFCGSNININKLGRLGLSTEELEIVAQHAKDGTLKNMLTVAQIAWQALDPEKATSKFQVQDAISKFREASNQSLKTFYQDTKDFIERLCTESEGDKLHIVKEYEEKSKSMIEAFQKEITQSTKTIEKLEQANQKQYSELRDDLREIREKIVGTGIGNVSEMVTIRDLKELVPTDSFSEARASKGGTDIVATVKEKGTICGVITINNKCTQKWEGNFLSQLTRDMKDDGSRFGILVTKAFPREALSSKAYPVDVDDGRTIILVKP